MTYINITDLYIFCNDIKFYPIKQIQILIIKLRFF